MELTFTILTGHLATILGYVRPQHILHQFLKALLLLGAEFLENGPGVGSGLEVALMSGQLHPRIALFLVGLEERGPLHDVAEFAPTRYLQAHHTSVTKIVSRSFL